jgi:hypothetical protein
MSILAQLELNEATEVDFGIEIHGTSEATSEIRFIIEGPQYGIVCRCTENNGVITATIPKLKGIIPAGTFDARLEVVVDGKFFAPLKESIEFKPMVEFDVTSAKAKPMSGPRVETKNVKVRVIEKAPEPVVEAAPESVAPTVKKAVKKIAPVQLPADLEESWDKQIEEVIETPAPIIEEPVKVAPKKVINSSKANLLRKKIQELKEQIKSVKQ